jgi:predicted ATPase
MPARARPSRPPNLSQVGFIRSVSILREGVSHPGVYPFDIPAVKALDGLTLDPRVTFFVGENGTGKSTLVEGIAVAAGFNPEGGGRNFNFATSDTHSSLGQSIRLVRNPARNRDGYFLRAESVYNLSSELEELRKTDALAYRSYGGQSLHTRSHGEAFMAVLEYRLGGDGLYILDEPESALSPLRQLACLARMKQLVRAGSQFSVATHSPILMAYPRATIYQLSQQGIVKVAYEETEHYAITKAFMDPDERRVMLDVLME